MRINKNIRSFSDFGLNFVFKIVAFSVYMLYKYWSNADFTFKNIVFIGINFRVNVRKERVK